MGFNSGFKGLTVAYKLEVRMVTIMFGLWSTLRYKACACVLWSISLLNFTRQALTVH